MACRKYERWISDDMDGRLPEKKRSALREHLKECECCRSYQENLRLLQAEARKFRDTAILSGLMNALDKRLVEGLRSGPAAESEKTVSFAGRRKWALARAAVLVLALVGVGVLLRGPKKPTDLWPVSYEDLLARIYGEIGEDVDMAESFDQVLQASIGETLLPAENPKFWENLDEDEIRLMGLEVTDGWEN
jgi:predicted anti-sigma-YlaC factor YlaD